MLAAAEGLEFETGRGPPRPDHAAPRVARRRAAANGRHPPGHRARGRAKAKAGGGKGGRRLPKPQ